MAESDFISIHTVLSSRTKELIDASKLKLMKKTSFLINTSRGPIVNELALVNALGEGEIAGAALDVFSLEPLPSDHPLITLENTIITPHIGYVTNETYKIFYEQTVECIIGFIQGNPIRVIGPI